MECCSLKSKPMLNESDSFQGALLIVCAVSFVTSLATRCTGSLLRRTCCKHVDQKYLVYCAKNITKAVILAPLSVFGIVVLVYGVLYGAIPKQQIRLLGTIYVGTDGSGLILMYDRLPKSTLMHHCVVMVIGICNLVLDFGQDGVWLCWVIFTVMSASA